MLKRISKFSIKVTTFCNLNCLYCHQLSIDKDYPSLFNKFDELEEFLLKLPFEDEVIVTITGGEITTRPELFLRTIKSLNNVSKKMDVKFIPAITTNGSNMIKVFEWIQKKIIKPEQVNLSWDGCESFSKIRKGKGVHYNDAFFNKNIYNIGHSPYNKLINISYALTPYNIDNFYNDFRFVIECGCRNFSYYYIHEGDYTNKEFLKKAEIELSKINDFIVNNLYNMGEEMYFYNHNVLYTRKYEMLKNDKIDDSKFIENIRCHKLGRSFHIDTMGDIYPCIYFGDHRSLQIGNLDDGGFYEDRLNEFMELYNAQFNCDKTCTNYQCFECPAANYVDSGNMNHRNCKTCEMYTLENKLFDKIKSNNLHNILYMTNCSINIYNPLTNDNEFNYLPIANKKDNYKESKNIKSEHDEEVKTW